MIFAYNHLMAVATHLKRSVSDDICCDWYLEAGFGLCATAEASRLSFHFQLADEAQQWMRKRMTRV